MNFLRSKPKFKIGDIIVCIDDRNWNSIGHTFDIIYQKKYKILNLHNSCHNLCIDIGCKFIEKLFTICSVCKSEIPGQYIHWAGSFRFRTATKEEIQEFNKQSKEEIELLIEQNVLIENYEKAHELQKLLGV